jgi:hypothetical protein
MIEKPALGALPDTPDKNDYLLSAIKEPVAVTLPADFSLRSTMTPVKMQGQVPSCTAFMSAGMKEPYDSVEFGKIIDLSEQWFYGRCKQNGGNPGPGEYPRVCMDTLVKFGICEESFMPYENRYPPLCSPKPGADENALIYRTKAYAGVNDSLPSIMNAIYTNGPVGVSIWVYANFYGIGPNGIVPSPAGNKEGGHAIIAMGWRTVNGVIYLECKNSWSEDFGDDGYVWIRQDIWDKISIGDCWTIVDLTSIEKHWTDWPETNILEQDLVFKSKLILGYPDKTVHPWDNLKKRHVALIMERSHAPVDSKLLADKPENYVDATRGWVRDMFPFLNWDSERWDEPITRFQFILLLARYLATGGTVHI